MAEVNFLVKKGLTVPKGSATTPSIIFDAADGNTGIYSPGADQLALSTAGTGRLFVDASGRVLVGTSSARDNYFGGTSGNACRLEVEGADYKDSGISFTSTNTTIAGWGPHIALGRTRGAGDVIVNNDDGTGSIIFHGNDGAKFVQSVRIDAFVDGTPGADTMPGRLVFSTTSSTPGASPTERMRIRSTGAISMSSGLVIGGTGDPGSSFYITSDVITSGAGNSTLKYNSTSGLVTYDTSSRLVKENIEDCPYGIDDLKQLKPRKYLRTDDQRTEIGFIADEVIDLMPEFVPVGAKSILTKNASDTELIPLGVNYEKLTAVLTKALQEAIGEIESLKARVAALESA